MNYEPKSRYTFRRWSIPPHMLGPINRYVMTGAPVGDFLTAVLTNNLKESCSRADDTNLGNLPAYCAFLYIDAPGGCFGSEENVKSWRESGGLNGIEGVAV